MVSGCPLLVFEYEIDRQSKQFVFSLISKQYCGAVVVAILIAKQPLPAQIYQTQLRQ